MSQSAFGQGAVQGPALILIDLQDGFGDPAWGRTNPHTACRQNCLALVAGFRDRHLPIVLVRHDSPKPDSPLRPGQSGNQLDHALPVNEADLLITKSVNSAFYGTPDLHEWLQHQSLHELVICGIQTNMCVETTARMAGNLGYAVTVPIDATRTFDLTGPTINGHTWHRTADELLIATAISLHGGGFSTVTTTEQALAALATSPRTAPSPQPTQKGNNIMWTTRHTDTTTVPIQQIWDTLTAIHRGELTLPGGDTFEPHGPLGVGTRIKVTPAGQDTMTSTITAFDAPHRYADRTEFGDLVLDFAHDLTLEDGQTRLTHTLTITGPSAGTVGPDLGPQISSDFPEQMTALIAAASQQPTVEGGS